MRPAHDYTLAQIKHTLIDEIKKVIVANPTIKPEFLPTKMLLEFYGGLYELTCGMGRAGRDISPRDVLTECLLVAMAEMGVSVGGDQDARA